MTTIHLISHTHWDREWYLTFQQFRFKLVHLIDKLLDLLERDSQFSSFLFDGQAIILEDYLEIRPERRDELEKHIKSGRLWIGPWYVSPDEFLITPETHIRNVLMGDRICHGLGGKMLVGYLPDTFGHIGQMPQLLRGFGIDTACMWRGLDDQPCELDWQAPDGSSVLLSYLRDSYSNAASLVTRDLDKFLSQAKEQAQSLEPYSLSGQILLMYGTDHMEPSAGLGQAVQYYQFKAGQDELFISNLPRYFASVRSSLAASEVQLQSVQGELRSSKHSPLLPNVLSTRIWIKQRNFTCENDLLKWVEPIYAWSSLLEKANVSGKDASQVHQALPVAAQKPLIDYAWKLLMQCHPHDSICGTSIDQVHEEMRIRFDQVDQLSHELIAQGLQHLSNQVDTVAYFKGDQNQEAQYLPLALVLFNPNDAAQTGLARHKLMLANYAGSFEIVDCNGHPVKFHQSGMGASELISMKLDKKAMKQAMGMIHEGNVAGLVIRDFKLTKQGSLALVNATLSDHAQLDSRRISAGLGQMEAMLADPEVHDFIIKAYSDPEIEISLVAQDVPSHGYSSYYLRQVKTESKEAQPVKINPFIRAFLPIAGKLMNSPLFSRWLSRSNRKTSSKPDKVENDFFLVEARPGEAGITITDKHTGQVLQGMNQFIDGGDCGDLYNYCPPEQDSLVSSRIRSVSVDRSEAYQRLKVNSELWTPAEITANRKARAKQTVCMQISSTLTLIPGVPRIDICTDIENHACDHRLRVHFPAPFKADHAYYDGHFEIVKRPIGIAQFDETWEEPPRPEVPQCQFTAVADGQHSLFIANHGLPEVEVLHNAQGNAEIAITLLRCVGWLSRDDLSTRKGHAGPMGVATPAAQLDGKHTFEYSIIPGEADWRPLAHQAHNFNASLRSVTTSIHPGPLLQQDSLVASSDPNFLLTTIKPAENGAGIIIRGYNCLPSPVSVTLQFSREITQVQLASLDESPTSLIPVSGLGSIDLLVGGNKIITLLCSR